MDGIHRPVQNHVGIQGVGWRAQPVQAVAAESSASSMIFRMVRAQRPHWALQPRQP
jgi:hypothetical protein